MKKKREEVAIIGAGFTGLAAAYYLAKRGLKVTVFESSKMPGGLALGFKDKKWDWSVEYHYHHLFATDDSINKLAKEVNHPIDYVRPKTSTFYKGDIKQIDSPVSLLLFPHLSVVNRLRTGLVLLFLKLTPTWQPLERMTVKKFILKSMGKQSWNVLWKPLMEKKFGKYADRIPASWFWARVKSRTASLGYPRGGFQVLADKIALEIKRSKGEIIFSTSIISIERNNEKIELTTQKGKKYSFDKVICTLPTPIYLGVTKGLPKEYRDKIKKLEGIGASNLVLSLTKGFLKDETYWLNINEMSFPFLAIVEHSNFVNPKNYNGERLLYIGNYLNNTHRKFKLNQEELIKIYTPYLKKINPDFDTSWIKKSWLFKANFAQPIVFKKYSKSIPSIKTPITGLYLANMQQVYPWDRGTNYAVELGEKVARLIGDD